MAMSGSGSGDGMLAEINVTPLVDVMLVLLIIFMITAPLMQQGVEINLPQTKAELMTNQNEQPLELRLTRERKIFIGEVEIPYAQLEEKLKFNERLQREKKLDLAADRALDYGFVVDIMATVRRVGIEQLGILTEPPPREP
jgi:biopolymer transport protein TolR